MARQIETHHYVARVNEDFLQCVVYDSNASHARLIGKLGKAHVFFPEVLVAVDPHVSNDNILNLSYGC